MYECLLPEMVILSVVPRLHSVSIVRLRYFRFDLASAALGGKVTRWFYSVTELLYCAQRKGRRFLFVYNTTCINVRVKCVEHRNGGHA